MIKIVIAMYVYLHRAPIIMEISEMRRGYQVNHSHRTSCMFTTNDENHFMEEPQSKFQIIMFLKSQIERTPGQKIVILSLLNEPYDEIR